MTFYEFCCCNKLYNAALGYIDRRTVTKDETKVALEALKTMTDNRNDWTIEQKDRYKELIEFVKVLLEEK